MQIECGQQFLKLAERLLTEVAELEQVGLVEDHELAEGLVFCRLEAVECSNREVHVNKFGLEQLPHLQYFLVKLLVAVGLGVVEDDLTVGEELEVLDENLGSALEGVLGMNGAIGGDLDDELLVVGLLLDTEVLDGGLHVQDGSVDRVDSDHVDGVIGVAVLLGGNISPALVDRELDLETARGVDVADLELGVENLERAEDLADVARFKDALT